MYSWENIEFTPNMWAVKLVWNIKKCLNTMLNLNILIGTEAND